MATLFKRNSQRGKTVEEVYLSRFALFKTADAFGRVTVGVPVLPDDSTKPAPPIDSRLLEDGSALKIYGKAELDRGTSNWKEDNLLGEGGSGKVYRCFLDSEYQHAAIKICCSDEPYYDDAVKRAHMFAHEMRMVKDH